MCVEQEAEQQAWLGAPVAPAVAHALDDHHVERLQQDLLLVEEAIDLPAENDSDIERVGVVHRRLALPPAPTFRWGTAPPPALPRSPKRCRVRAESAACHPCRPGRRNGFGYSFAIAAEDARPGAVGQVGLWPNSRDPGRASSGYFVVERHRGVGLAGRALAALATWAFEAIGIVRLELYVEPWNVGSIRTAERTGFVREGLLRQAQRVGVERRDMFIYGRLRDDLWNGAG
jgi:ribosomal-protein-alanine N-acetyltransferase